MLKNSIGIAKGYFDQPNKREAMISYTNIEVFIFLIIAFEIAKIGLK
jgi:hypothetical protein